MPHTESRAAKPLRELALDAAIEVQRFKVGKTDNLIDSVEFLREVRRGFLKQDAATSEHLSLLPIYQKALIPTAGRELRSRTELMGLLNRLVNEIENDLKTKRKDTVDRFINFCVAFHAALMTFVDEEKHGVEIPDKPLKRF